MAPVTYSDSANYAPLLDLRETELAIKEIKDFFQDNLAAELHLSRITAPLFVEAGTGINDDLNGVERPVSFTVKDMADRRVEVVQSLAKWKRLALADLKIPQGEGIHTDMNAIRPDEKLDNLHSIYVDQWDWERVLKPDERNLELLKQIARKIYGVVRRTEAHICRRFPAIDRILPEDIIFIHTEELEERFPNLSPAERERQVAQEHGAVFVIGIGAPLSDGKPHDGRAPDYDDWITPNGPGRGLNGDIIVWFPLLNEALELSSMGIRVSPDSLREQLKMTNTTEREELYFHRRLLSGELPLSIGGGIGQSRLCMFMLRKAHIGEIQAGIWPEDMREACRRQRIVLL
jgi:aspartate--ammonia ligase